MRSLLTSFFVYLLLLPGGAFAAVDYNLIAPIPGGGNSVSSFEQYVGFLFPFLLLFAAAAALVMFIIGSILYIYSASNPSQLSRAKDFMVDAILGLLLALCSVLILQAINPKLVSLKLDLPGAAGNPTNQPSNENATPSNPTNQPSNSN
jgi:hypothetical protein